MIINVPFDKPLNKLVSGDLLNSYDYLQASLHLAKLWRDSAQLQFHSLEIAHDRDEINRDSSWFKRQLNATLAADREVARLEELIKAYILTR